MRHFATKFAIFKYQQLFWNQTGVEMSSAVKASSASIASTTRVLRSTRRSLVGTETTETPLTEEEIDRKPWKYIGYKGYAEFIASDNDFYIVRQFATLNVRIMLALQDQVSVLEDRLQELDVQYSRRNAEDLHNGSFRDDRQDRSNLIENISDKLIKYSEVLLQNQSVGSL